MGVNPNPFSPERAEAAARNQRRELYEQALREHKETLASQGLPWNQEEAERFDHQWRIEHIPLPGDLSLKRPKNLLYLLLSLATSLLPLYWAYTDAFVRGNTRSLLFIAAFLISLIYGAWSLIRQMITAEKVKKIGAEAWLNEEAHRQKTKGIYPWNASEHASWM